MDQATIAALLTFLGRLEPRVLLGILGILVMSPTGVVGLIIWLWYRTERKQSTLIQAYRDDMLAALQKYGQDMIRYQNYYDTNVELVKAQQKIADGLQDTVVLNTATMQRMIDVCINNQFCPNARLPK